MVKCLPLKSLSKVQIKKPSQIKSFIYFIDKKKHKFMSVMEIEANLAVALCHRMIFA